MTDTPLLPCPFCGGEAVWRNGPTDQQIDWWQIECRFCEIATPAMIKAEFAIDKWNRRMDTLAQGARVPPAAPLPTSDDTKP